MGCHAAVFSWPKRILKRSLAKWKTVCPVVRQIQIWHSFWKPWSAASFGLMRKGAFQLVISAQFKSLDLWWYGGYAPRMGSLDIWKGTINGEREIYTNFQAMSFSGCFSQKVLNCVLYLWQRGFIGELSELSSLQSKPFTIETFEYSNTEYSNEAVAILLSS